MNKKDKKDLLISDASGITSILNEEGLSPILEELYDKFYDIPFSNSEFQDENFVLKANLTPARAYRSLGLELLPLINKLLHAYYQLEEADYKIEKIRKKVKNFEISERKREKLRKKLMVMLNDRKYQTKLLNDSVKRANYFYGILQTFPEYNQKTFEAEERLHFEKRLAQQLETSNNGALLSLTQMQEENTPLTSLLETALKNIGRLEVKNE